MTLSDALTKKMAAGLRRYEGGGGVIMKRQNDVNFSKIVWRRP